MRKSSYTIWDRSLAWLFLVYLLELILTGPIGIVIWDTRIRFVIIFLLFGMSLVSLVSGKITNKELKVLTVFSTIFLIWSILIPIFKNGNLIDAVSEGRSLFIMFLIIPISRALLYFGTKFIVNFISYLVGIVAIAVFTCWICSTYFNNYLPAELLFNYLDTGIGAGLYIGPMPDGSYRVMFITSIFFPFVILAQKNSRYFWGWAGLMMAGVIASGTRAIFIGAIFAIVVIVWNHRKKYLKQPVFYMCIIIGLLYCQFYYDNFSNTRFLDLSDEFDSDSIRLIQLSSLMELWKNNIIFGAGFGAVASEVREGYSYELTYVALLAKIGIIGMGLLCVLFIVIFANIPTKTARFNVFMIGLLFLFVTSTNPYLINLFGLTLLSFLVVLAWNSKADLSKRSHGSQISLELPLTGDPDKEPPLMRN